MTIVFFFIVRQQCGGLSEGPGVRLQGSVPAAERSEDPGAPWSSMAPEPTRGPISAGPRRSAYPTWCGHQGTARALAVIAF